MKIEEFLKNKRESLSPSSIKTYSSILRSLYKKVFGNDEIDFDNFNKTDKILEHLKDLPSNKRKTILSALVIATDNNKYRTLMLDDVKDYNNEIKKQEKTDTQKENWLEKDELDSIYNLLKKQANAIYRKPKITNNDLQILQNFILVALFKLIPPRRAKDYVDFKIKSVDTDTDNYMDKNKFIFNSYKTSKFYGKQVIDVPKELVTIINKWKKINPTEYLLFDSNLNKLTNVKLNQRFNKIFGKKASVNALRHSFLTDKYADAMKQKTAMSNDLKDMGSSIAQAETYIKID